MTLEPLLWEIKEHVHSGDTKFGPGKIKCPQSVTFIDGTPLLRGMGYFTWVPKWGFNLHYGDTLAPQNATDHKEIAYLTQIDLLLLWEFNTQYLRNKLPII